MKMVCRSDCIEIHKHRSFHRSIFNRWADVSMVWEIPTRLRILRLLMDGEVCVRCISEELGMGQSAYLINCVFCGMPAWFSSGGKVRTCSIPWPMPDVFTLLNVGLSTSAE